MRKFILSFLMFIAAMGASAQTTPNIGLQLPNYNSTNWGVALNYNFSRLDGYLSGTLPTFWQSGTSAPSSGCPYTTTASTVNGSDVITVASYANLEPGQTAVGTGIQSSTIVSSVSGNSITLSTNATASGSGVSVSFYPYGAPYTDISNNTQYVCAAVGWVSLGGSGTYIPAGTANQLLYYATPGTSLTPLNLSGSLGVTSGTLGITNVPISEGGTGATTASAAITNLGALPSTALVASPQFKIPYYSGSGTAQVLTGDSGITTNGSGNLSALSVNNICNASSQGLANAGLDIQACINSLPANNANCSVASGGIVDASGFTGSQIIAGLTIDRPVILKLGSATYDVTGILNATNIPCGVTIEGDGAKLVADTGSGNPVIDFTGTSKDILKGIRIAAGSSNPSTIGILEARSATYPNPWWHHYEDIQIMLGTNPTANGGVGSIGIYNYGAEVAHYENVTIPADKPLVGTRTNIYSVTAPDVPFYTGLTTMDAVQVDGKSDFYSSTSQGITLDGADQWNIDMGELSGANLPGVYAIYATGQLNNDYIGGEFENYSRMFYLAPGSAFISSRLYPTCASCQAKVYNGNITYTSGSTTATPASMANLAVGQMITSTAVPTSTWITAVGSTTITLSAAATSSGSIASSTAEPIIVLDSTSGSVNVTGTDFDVFDGASSPQQTWYLLGLGTDFADAVGWKIHLLSGTNIYWQSSNLINGTVYVNPEMGYPYPTISSDVYGFVISNGSVSVNNSAGGNVNASTGSFTNLSANTLSAIAPIQIAQSTGSSQYFANVPGSGWGILRDTAGSGVAIGVGSSGNGFLVWANGNTTTPGDETAQHVISSGTPTIACGTGAGTSPTVCTVTGNDEAGQIAVTTGSAPAGSATIATITLHNACPTSVYAIVRGSNANAASLSGTTHEYPDNFTATTWTITANSTGLAASTAYTWAYIAKCN